MLPTSLMTNTELGLPAVLGRTLSRMTNPTLWRVCAIFGLAVTLTACGFHLRGNIPLADGLKNMHLSAPNGTFKGLLEDRLQTLGANLMPSTDGADVILNVTQAESSRTVGTLDGRGKVNSYNVLFKVQYTLLDAAGSVIRPNGSVRELRRYDFDPEDVIASETEEEDLLEDMEKEAVLKVLRQLASITDFQPNAPAQKTTKSTTIKDD